MSIRTYLDIRDVVIGHIRTRLPNRRIHVDAHPGRFDITEMERLYTTAPALLTSLMRAQKRNDANDHRLEWTTWVLTRGDTRDPLMDLGLSLVSWLTPCLEALATEWSVGTATDIDARNVYSGAAGRLNVSLWAVSWAWRVRASIVVDDQGGLPLPDELAAFTGYDATHEVGEQIAGDTVDLPPGGP